MNKSVQVIFILSLLLGFWFFLGCRSSPDKKIPANPPDIEKGDPPVIPGAHRMEEYVPELKNKNIGLVVNHTSLVGSEHLVDTLLRRNISVKKIFAPEHGFRGKHAAGEKVSNQKDPQTGLPLISLYGANKKPTRKQLQGLDHVIFDIQDVGARFYTYISTLHYVMEACAENNIEVTVLDRPNPNGDYIAGPVLDTAYQSFVGMHPIPIVYGLTNGELAKMINGEKWLKNNVQCSLNVVKCKHYTHNKDYHVPVAPSPNLPNQKAIRLYPSLCLFEGTRISVGRGTPFPFQVAGAPEEYYGSFSFTPRPVPGKAPNPKYKDQTCYGVDYRDTPLNSKFSLKPLIQFYKKTKDKKRFFNGFFNKLAGNNTLKEKIKKGMNAKQIRQSWEKELDKFKTKRKKYLLYPDFN